MIYRRYSRQLIYQYREGHQPPKFGIRRTSWYVVWEIVSGHNIIPVRTDLSPVKHAYTKGVLGILRLFDRWHAGNLHNKTRCSRIPLRIESICLHPQQAKRGLKLIHGKQCITKDGLQSLESNGKWRTLVSCDSNIYSV